MGLSGGREGVAPAVQTGGQALSRLGRAPRWLAPLLAALVVLLSLDVPLVEDGLFWWVPQGLWVAERGFALSPAGDLPEAVATSLVGQDAIPQWGAGIPDYDHPPLWFWWLGLFLAVSPTVQAVHLASLLPAMIAARGWVAVGERLGSGWAGLAPLCLPPVLAQLMRPELDLPLLAVVPWALVALLDRRWAVAIGLGLLAPWCKEPGVLLAAPACLAALAGPGPRALRVTAGLAPLGGLLLWRVVHGRLASPERLPADLGAWLVDLTVVARIGLVEQGRFALLLGLPLLALHLHRRPRHRRPASLLGAFALVWLGFFATVGFFATRDSEQSLTHVRYFLPGLCALTVLLTSRLPPLAMPGLLFLTTRSPFGPEASLYGLQAGLAERDAAPWMVEQVQTGRTVWVGSYQAAALFSPWAGVWPGPLPGPGSGTGRFRVYAEATDPASPAPGDIVIEAAYGEPLGALERALELSALRHWPRGDATVTAWEVVARRPDGSR